MALHLDRISRVTVEQFIVDHIRPQRPVIVTDAMDAWPALNEWTPEGLSCRYGDQTVPLYGKYFDLVGTTTLRDYVDLYMMAEHPGPIPYVRWFTKHQDVGSDLANKIPWADEIFTCLRDQWSHPYFLPTNAYLLPFCSPEQTLDVASDTTVPSKALYLSGRGAVTNLHIDFWGSDAVLCQVHGEKDIILYPPGQTPLLTQTARMPVRGTSGAHSFVDIRQPDLARFPDFTRSRPAFRDRLSKGEIAYIPAGWPHHVDTLTSSVMLTWNFVHLGSWRGWFKFLIGNPPKAELRDIEYLLLEDPKRLV